MSLTKPYFPLSVCLSLADPLIVCSPQNDHNWEVASVASQPRPKPVVRALLRDLQPYSAQMNRVVTSLVCSGPSRKQAAEVLQLPVFAGLPQL